jgi:hypothetical protein
VDPAILAPHARARLAARLSRPVTLAVLGLTVRLDAGAANTALGRLAVEQIIDLAVGWVGSEVLMSMEFMWRRTCEEVPR